MLCALAGAGAAHAQQDPPSITVTGSASVSAPPDTAEVTAGVVSQGATAAQALSLNNVAMDQVLRAITGLGIADRDVRTTGVSVNPQRAQPQPNRPQTLPAIVGYEVSNQVHVKVRRLADLGRVLDVLVGQGANALGGLSFSIADPAPLLQQARQRAVADAQQKAQVFAQAAGVKLGRVIYIRDTPMGGPRPVMAMRQMASAGAVPIAAGEQEIEASVSITYGIE